MVREADVMRSWFMLEPEAASAAAGAAPVLEVSCLNSAQSLNEADPC